MKEKITTAIIDMKGKVGRDSKHVYVNNETGIKMQGVSTVSSIVPKEWLASWGAKEAVKALGYTDYSDHDNAFNIWEQIKDCECVEEYIKILKEAKGAHARKSKKAMVDGTSGHLWLETFVEARIHGHSIPSIPTGTPLERPISQFLEWEGTEVDYWIASEAIVNRIDKSYAGQLDAIYMSKSGKLCLCDFKFASNISEEYYLQARGYQACFEPYGIIFDNAVIIRLPKQLEREEWNEKEFKYEMKPNNIEIRVLDNSTYERDRDAFFAALWVKAWINAVESLKK